MIICFIDIVIYTRNKINTRLLIIKLCLTVIPSLLYQISTVISKIILPKSGLTNISQIKKIDLYFLLVSYILGGILLVIHAKLSGFLEKHWVTLIFCTYLLIWFTFGLVFYSIDYNGAGDRSFSYSEKLEKNIRSRNIYENNDFPLDNLQKTYIDGIINSEKNKMKYIDLKIGGQENILTNEKIGDYWSGYYYENLIKKYNTFTIEAVSDLKLTSNYLNKDDINFDNNYKEFFNKEYVLVRIMLYNSNYRDPFGNTSDTENSNMIIEKPYSSTETYSNGYKKEVYLVFEKENYENYCIPASNVRINIFLNCLTESNTLLDKTIIEINTRNSGSSNNMLDYLYYSAVVITTLGFGDMLPVSLDVRILTIIEAFLGLIIMGLFLTKAFEKNEKN